MKTKLGFTALMLGIAMADSESLLIPTMTMITGFVLMITAKEDI